MPADALDTETLLRMRLIIERTIQRCDRPVSEAAAEATGFAHGRHPALPYVEITEAVTGILHEFGALPPEPEPMHLEGSELLPAAVETIAETLSYAMRFDERGKARGKGHVYAVPMAALELARALQRDGYVLLRHPPNPGRHGEGR